MRLILVLLICALFATPVRAGEGAQRILSIGGAITETVYALGAQDRLVAVDTTSLYPPEARGLPNVGYMRALSAEPVLSLDPDLILLHADAGPVPVIEQIRQSGVRIVDLPKTTSIADTGELIRRVGAALARPEAGAALAEKVVGEATRISALARARDSKPRVLFMLSIGRGAPLASGHGTAADGLIAAAGGRNAIDGYEGYKPLSPEAAVEAAPDVVLVTHRTAKLLGGAPAILSRAEIQPTPAGKQGRLLEIDGLMMLGFGPRLHEAIAVLARQLHPDLDLGAVQ